MSIGESLQRASLSSKRRLFDLSVESKGRKIQAVKISVAEEDIFGDKDTAPLEAHDITAIIRFPDQMPLERYRYDNSAQTEETRTYFYDLLPIQAYTKLYDKVEKDDFIVFSLEDEQGNTIPFLFQVTDTFGKFEIGLIWKMSYLAHYNGKLPEQVAQYISDNFRYY